eukprot:CAMPEP_0206329258 /NCGR_PEP_ID=MMETSP0106_2-20121207/23105_1 /ASSEMBLY_ACC=CAM_ASM_000206 /TAXON_ID=81532 /ORGANISM="Acanthoeca-like sp., Strain 10tr" /LENGTH=54 /DNA_ID=CAMNT_0053761969 /DNA_START=651 /DNA_END=815 /DNA_ORIENTATION=+
MGDVVASPSYSRKLVIHGVLPASQLAVVSLYGPFKSPPVPVSTPFKVSEPSADE